jgi:hypothetical protein
MIRIIGFMKKKEGLILDEFSHYWGDKHAPLALKVIPKPPNVN